MCALLSTILTEAFRSFIQFRQVNFGIQSQISEDLLLPNPYIFSVHGKGKGKGKVVPVL
jgi:hypothetical protein